MRSVKIDTDASKIEDLLTRGVEDIIEREHLADKLSRGIKLKVKFGIDPTSPHIHLGRAVPLRKLRRFQELGHEIILVVGDFTAQIGDASDKLLRRPMLSENDVHANMEGYRETLGKILDIDSVTFLYNGSWLAGLSMKALTELAEIFSVQQMLARRNFKIRHETGTEISLREFLYPLFQGYDSFHIASDIEIGGSDQLFNLKAGRTIQKHLGQDEQDILTMKMLRGTDGRKMSSSWGNVISISDTPQEMFGRTMSLRDELIGEYLTLSTDTPLEEIEEYEKGMKGGHVNPRDIKLLLAERIVTLYHGAEAARTAREAFLDTFSRGKPQETEVVFIEKGKRLEDILLERKIVSSRSSLYRLLTAGAIRVYRSGIETPLSSLDEAVNEEMLIRVGKKKFITIKNPPL